ncbi:hypothetical protein ACQ86N_20200 [Puia sp. P3]|uniref:hypothetical protein n=1 Tax=Puia sp. P3 TaxID=3423952 RepID=UPI003D677762
MKSRPCPLVTASMLLLFALTARGQSPVTAISASLADADFHDRQLFSHADRNGRIRRLQQHQLYLYFQQRQFQPVRAQQL